jgi:ABC-2 type transport system permease protein
MWRLVAPRFTAYAIGGAVAYLIGTLAAWYETHLLIGPLPVGGVAAGVLCAAVYLAFAVAVTAFAASLTTTTVASVGITLGILLVLPLLGDVHPISTWVPSALIGAPADLVDSPSAHDLVHFLPALGVSAVAGAIALAAAVLLLRRREI